MNQDNQSRIIAAVCTVVVHGLLLVILLNNGLSRLVPEEEGLAVMAVALGADENGGDDLFEPTPASEVEGAQASQPAPEPNAAPEQYNTQDIEESVAMPDAEKKKKEEERKQKELAEKRKKEAELAEARRIEAEKKALQEAQDKKAKEIGNKLKNVFGGSGTGGVGNNQSSNGVGGGKSSGSKGNPFGNSSEANSEGSASEGTGKPWLLEGRELVGGLKKPDYKGSDVGRIVVRIKVDNNGNVIYAETIAGTNIDNPSLQQSCKDAAKRTKFNPIKSGNNQDGFITYTFNLN